MDTRALPSMVSLMKEKTVSYVRCHSRGFEKVIWPIACMAILVMSIILFAVGCGTQNWIQMEVRNNASEQRGNITFGLLRGAHRIRYGESPFINTINGSYFLFNKLSLGYLAKFNATFGLSMVAILLCLLNIAVTLLNSYQSVTTWWRGPTMMYLLSLFASLCGLTALGVFLDHYLWELDTVRIFISTTELSPENALTINNLTLTSFEYLLTEDGYHSVPSLDFSFYVEVAGACLPLVVTLLAWRLALLIPPRKLNLEERRPHDPNKHYPLKDSNSLQYFSAGPNPNLKLQDLTAFNYSYEEREAAMTSSADDYSPSMGSPSGTAISLDPQQDVLY